jgi:hypothetical protein
MTQKKVAIIPTVDELIEKGDVPAIIAEYVRLTLSANRLRDFLLEDPALAGVLSGLVGHINKGIPVQHAPWQAPVQHQGNSTSWNPLLTQQEHVAIPGMQEPPGIIHKDTPATYEYPMDNYGEGNPQQAVINLLQGITSDPPARHAPWQALSWTQSATTPLPGTQSSEGVQQLPLQSTTVDTSDPLSWTQSTTSECWRMSQTASSPVVHGTCATNGEGL